MTGAVRPYEEASLARAFDEATALVACRTPAAWSSSPGPLEPDYPPVLASALERRISAVLWQDDSCRVLALKSP